MTQRKVLVDVTTHKEQVEIAIDMRKKKKNKQNKMRVRYYIEVLVEYSPSNQMRLGFSGSFRALAILHETFIQLWIEKYGHTITNEGAQSYQQQQQQLDHHHASSSSSSSSLKKFFHSFKSGSTTTSSSNGTKIKQEEVEQRMLTEKVTKLPFPSKTSGKMLLLLEKNEAKHDEKIEARQKALFEYFNELLNNGETSDLFLEYLRQRSESDRKLNLTEEQETTATATVSTSRNLLKKMISKLDHPDKDKNQKTLLEFKPPIYHRKIVKSPKKKRKESR